MDYEEYTPLNTFGSQAEFTALATPPGTSMEPQLAELMRDVVGLLGLPEAGVVTPWAERRGDFDVPIRSPTRTWRCSRSVS
jgi:hypothetical protein